MSEFTVVGGGLLAAVVIGGFAGIGIAYTTWRRRDLDCAKPFAVYSLAYSAWMFAAAFLWLSPANTPALVFDILTELLGTATMLGWAYFVISYTGLRDRSSRWLEIILGSYVVVYLVRIAEISVNWFTGDLPGIETYSGLTVVTTHTEIEPYGLGIVSVFGGLMILFWTFLVLWQFQRSEVSGQRRQARLILFTGMLPTFVYLGYVAAGMTLHEHLDPTPLFFTLTVVGTWFALVKYDFLELDPIAANVLFKSMPDPVVILNDDHTVLNANDSAASLGFSIGEAAPDSLITASEEGPSEVTLETVDNDLRTFDMSITSIKDGRRRLVVLRDITLRMQREQVLEQQNERLDEFASVVSHDLRNPLAVASGNLDLLLETGNLERTEEIDQSLRRMEKIIEDLLTMAKAGRVIDATEPLQVAEIARAARQQVQGHSDVSYEIDADLTVEADQNRLQEMFENLFRNAIEHNEPPLTITIETIWSDGQPAGFAVSDDGSGVPPTDRGEVFTHGYTTTEDGTGLGLSIVQDIVSAHDWEITLTESEGGARFEITGVGLTGTKTTA